jgi:hypothetical protein
MQKRDKISVVVTSHLVCENLSSNVRGAIHPWSRRGGILSGDHVVFNLLAPTSQAGRIHCVVHDRHSGGKHRWFSNFRLHPGPHALAWDQQLEVALDTGRTSGHQRRCLDVSDATE